MPVPERARELLAALVLALVGSFLVAQGAAPPPRAAGRPVVALARSAEGAETFKGPSQLGWHASGVASADFSPDGKWVASGGGDKTIRVWDIATARQVKEFTGPSGFTCTVRFSPDGKVLAASGYESGNSAGLIHLYDLATGKERAQLSGHSSGVRRVVFTPDSKRLLSCGFDGMVRIWELASAKELAQIKVTPGNMIYSFALCPESKLVATASGDYARLFDLASGKELTRGDLPKVQATAVAFSQDGKLLATGSKDKIYLWEVATGRQVRELVGHGGEVSFLIFSTDGRTLYSSSYDKCVRVWEVRSGQQIRQLTGHTNWVWGIGLAPDERWLASSSADGKLLLWDLSSLVRPGAARPVRLTEQQREDAYAHLACADAGQAYEAVCLLASDPEGSLPYLRQRLSERKGAEEFNPARVARLIADLDSEEYPIREKASAELYRGGVVVAPALRRALQAPPSLEVKRRLERLLVRLESGVLPPEELAASRAVQVLEYIGTPESRKVLEGLVRSGSSVRLVDEASQALMRLARPTRLRTTQP